MRRILGHFTTRARCLLAGGAAAILFGLVFGSTDLVRAGGLLVLVPFVAYLVVSRSQVTIASRRALDPARTTVGGDVEVQLTVSNRSALPVGALMLEDRLPTQLVGRVRFGLEGLAGRESRTIAYKLPTPRRGRYTCGPLQVRLTDPFGLIELSRSFTAVSGFVVTPAVDALPDSRTPTSVDVGDNAGSHSIGTHGADDASTREYRYGDDLRKIHWRSTARTGALMVRLEERPWQGQVTVLLDTRTSAHLELPFATGVDPRSVSSLEWAVSAAASIGSQLLLRGREVGLVTTTAPGTRIGFSSPSGFVDQLADVNATDSRDLAPVIPQLRAAARDSTVIALLGALDDADVQAVADARARGSAAPAFALLLDRGSWRANRRTNPGQASLEAERLTDTIAETLRATGWWVAVARADDSVGATWSRLLRQRAFALGDPAWSAERPTDERIGL